MQRAVILSVSALALLPACPASIVVHPLPLDAAPHEPDAAPGPDAGVPADAAPSDAAPELDLAPDAAACPALPSPDRCVYSYRFTDPALTLPQQMPMIWAGHVQVTSYPTPNLGGSLFQDRDGLSVQSGVGTESGWIEHGERMVFDFDEDVPRVTLILEARDVDGNGIAGEARLNFWDAESLRLATVVRSLEIGTTPEQPVYVVELDTMLASNLAGAARVEIDTPPGTVDAVRVLGVVVDATRDGAQCPMLGYGSTGL